jgi:SnoaL-like domain
MTFYAADAVLDLSEREPPSFEGPTAIRGFLADWWSAYEELRYEPEEILVLGNEVTFSVVRLIGGFADLMGVGDV